MKSNIEELIKQFNEAMAVQKKIMEWKMYGGIPHDSIQEIVATDEQKAQAKLIAENKAFDHFIKYGHKIEPDFKAALRDVFIEKLEKDWKNLHSW